ncbi:septum formation initiator family protein [Lactobacillus hamsteri]|uniref:Septum formation initiator n=1 Tax=Lactobacillus hamsteri DSM 5661 = JCM 6256 TaxID=1423754 RepID=A0A0R1YF18_9LACO|nr:septum formation initiator family protein [Lactobacillus hamsteri]KRM41015.1 hypothetical protein FC39_GL001659 [Lactobacillus hamsteri DSM 5661 = JCM 6256]
MNNGPRLYNAESPQEREARLIKKQARMEKEIHRKRRQTIMGIFAVLFIILGVQIAGKISQTHRINDEVQASKSTLTEKKKENDKLTNQRDDLKDPNYIAKLVRYKFYYSKPNEKIYSVPEGKKN